MNQLEDLTVRQSTTVKASPEQAFRVFTADFDSWWPRTHHIGSSPMKKAILEGHVGGRCYSEQVDGTDCDWGQMLVWEPPHRLVFAWLIDAQWKYQPDLSQSSEVEVRFAPVGDGSTRVDLEHRGFERMTAGETVSKSVGSSGGWGMLLELFAKRVENA